MPARPAADILGRLRAAGFELALHPSGGIVITPSSRLSDSDRNLIKLNKAALIALLGDQPACVTEQDAAAPAFKQPPQQPTPDKRTCTEPVPMPIDAPLLPQPKPPPPKVGDAAWLRREGAHRAYMAHHFNCPRCQAAGRGRGYGTQCDAGADLWAIYENAIH